MKYEKHYTEETRNWWYIQDSVYHSIYKQVYSFIKADGKHFHIEGLSPVIVHNAMIHDKSITDKELAQFIIDSFAE